MKNIRFIIIIIIVINFGCQKAKHTSPDHITLTWAGDPHTTQTITWRTDTTELSGEVQYANIVDSAKFEAKAAKAEEKNPTKLKTDKGTWNIHSLTLKGLKPGKKYFYRVGYGNNWSSKSTFTTEAENTDSFKFLIFGDSQSGDADNPNYSPFQKTIHNAYNANTDAKFFVNMGDLVETGNFYAHWNKWFEAVKDIINKISFMPVQGNHETYKGPEEGSMKPVNFINQFNVPQNGPEGFKSQAYSYDYGDVHFAVWDSQFEEEQQIDTTMKRKELSWLANDLAVTNKKWKLVLFHKTPYYNKHERANDNLKAIVQPIIDKYHVDIVLNGHDHGISRTYPIKADKFVSKPSQGTVYYITGRSGNKKYGDLSLKVWDAFYNEQNDQPNYIVAEVNDEQLTLKAVKQDGTLLDTYTIDKSKDVDIPLTKLPERFKETRVVIYGSLLSKYDIAKKIDNKWYIPAEVFIKYFNGESNKENGKIIITINPKEPANKKTFSFKTFQNVDMISTDELKRNFGFNSKLDESMNMLMLSYDPVKI